MNGLAVFWHCTRYSVLKKLRFLSKKPGLTGRGCGTHTGPTLFLYGVTLCHTSYTPTSRLTDGQPASWQKTTDSQGPFACCASKLQALLLKASPNSSLPTRRPSVHPFTSWTKAPPCSGLKELGDPTGAYYIRTCRNG